MKRWIGFIILMFGVYVSYSQSPILTVNCAETGKKVSPTLYGVFFEDINLAADGGWYAELISNRSFEDNASNPDAWYLFKGTSSASIAMETTSLLNSAQSLALKLNVSSVSSNGRVGIANEGYWGVNVVKNREYQVSFFAKSANFNGTLTASLENSSNTTTYALTEIGSIGTEWKKYTCTLTATSDDSNGRFVLSTQGTGTLWLDVVSLFPPTYNNQPNGLRVDLMELVKKMSPKFVRFPGGCFVEGNVLANRFQWKNTIGAIETRSGHNNQWGYRTTDGMGMHEFLQACEDLNAAPLYVTNIGLAHNDNQLYTDIGWYIQDVLDAIEYANGDISTTYGAMRAANGHPASFNLKYIEIGNENNQAYGTASDHYYERYLQVYNAIKAKYPSIQCIGNVVAWGDDNPKWGSTYAVDLLDEHYYRTWEWFANNFNKYDSYSRTGAKIYTGEYAVTTNGGWGKLNNALGEAIFMAGMERNSDIVTMSSYAPLFGNVNRTQWNPNAIYYNSSTSYGTPSYYVQSLFASNLGDVNVPIKEANNIYSEPIKGAIGVGAWNTQVSYDNVQVTSSTSAILFSDTMDNMSQWTSSNGNWNANGTLNQILISSDCRAISKVQMSDNIYSYTVKAVKNGGNEGFLILFGYQDADNYYWLNLGGWGNTQHGLERCVGGTKTTVVSTAGSIQTGQAYTVRIEVNGALISCYLNNTLLFSYKAESKSLYYSCTQDSQSKALFLKIINPTTSEQTCDVVVKGFEEKTFFKATAQLLTSANGSDENSISNPLLVSPTSSELTTAATNFQYTFAKKSVTVFKLEPTVSLETTASNPTTSINNKTINLENQWSISPNPVENGMLNLDIAGIKDLNPSEVRICDLLGKQVYVKKLGKENRYTLRLHELSKGTYIVSLKGKQTLSKKLIVQ